MIKGRKSKKWNKGFDDVDVKIKEYMIKQSINDVPIEYKVVNGQVIINLKKIIEGVLRDQEIDGYKTNRIELSIPFSLNRQVTGNSMTIGINKKRYILRLKNLEIIPSKQQKIDYDNTHPHRWHPNQWLKFIASLFYNSYGFAAIELNKINRGKNCKLVSEMIEHILAIDAFETNHYSVVEYLRWIFDNKTHSHNLTLGLITCNAMIQDWIHEKSKTEKGVISNVKKRKRKWD